MLAEPKEKSSNSAPRWLTVDGAAKHSSLSVESIRRLLAAGKLTAHRPVRGRILIDPFELDSIISTATKKPRKGRGLSRSAT